MEDFLSLGWEIPHCEIDTTETLDAFTLRMMFSEPFAHVCLIAIFSARNVQFDHLES